MATRTYIPAQPGQIAHVISILDPADNVNGRPTEADVWVVTYAVIAWRITTENILPKDDSGEASIEKTEIVDPVFVEQFAADSDNDIWLVMPDGRLCLPDSGLAENLETAKQETLRQKQHQWDCRREKAAKAAAKQELPGKTGELAQH